MDLLGFTHLASALLALIAGAAVLGSAMGLVGAALTIACSAAPADFEAPSGVDDAEVMATVMDSAKTTGGAASPTRRGNNRRTGLRRHCDQQTRCRRRKSKIKRRY